MSKVVKLLLLIVVLAVAVAALNWFLLREREADLPARPDAPASEGAVPVPQAPKLEEVQAPSLREVEHHPVDMLRASPPPASAPKVVIPMSEITFERDGGNVVGDPGGASEKTYSFGSEDAARAGVELAHLIEARAKSLTAGCWYREERGVIDQLHATYQVAGDESPRVCVHPTRFSDLTARIVHVRCEDVAEPWDLEMLSEDEAKALDELLGPSAETPGRTWLRKVSGRPLIFQLQLQGQDGLSQIDCKITHDHRDCCSDSKWPNLDP